MLGWVVTAAVVARRFSFPYGLARITHRHLAPKLRMILALLELFHSSLFYKILMALYFVKLPYTLCIYDFFHIPLFLWRTSRTVECMYDVSTYVCIYLCYVCMYICMCVCIYVCVCTRVRIYVYVCIFFNMVLLLAPLQR